MASGCRLGWTTEQIAARAHSCAVAGGALTIKKLMYNRRGMYKGESVSFDTVQACIQSVTR